MKKIILGFFVMLFLYSCTSQDPYYIRQSDKITSSFSKEIRNKDSLCYLGGGGSMMNDVKLVSLSYFSSSQMSIDEARILLVRNVELLLEKFNNDLNVRPYLHNFPFTADNIKINILFLDGKNEEFYTMPYLAAVGLDKGVVFYSIWGAGILQTTYSEPYGDALKVYQDSW